MTTTHVRDLQTGQKRWEVFSTASGSKLGTFYDEMSRDLFIDAIRDLCSDEMSSGIDEFGDLVANPNQVAA